MKKILGVLAGVAALTIIGAPAAHAEIECIPQEAYTETVEHAAIGEPTVVIDNPDYVPAQPERENMKGYYKWVWTAPQKDKTPPTAPPPAQGWNRTGAEKACDGEPDTIVHKGNGNGSYFYCESVIEVIPAKPEDGMPQIEVENPDYVPAWTETVEHPGQTCDGDLTGLPATGGEGYDVLGAAGTVLVLVAGVLIYAGKKRKDDE